ncbi:hypothetical protein K490DRAFT_65277 [Saccharata proteae CBS 121410]|uniref:ADF-H domain-containing protein n=1 Tax=Saccharata proteae CBS 121410 TaxID=1314787 RepID=A0A9P4HW98_9PEZI|nr:hypothetical protein K490DRAFT_65277 [Saccharata proteae CBS 121410]
MSLNGLDDPQVSDAYTASLAEAGGWFLLKYSSRDAVQVLARGSGGVSEARAAIEQYTDKSPLYGFLLYRRRKVLLKYVPEGTSRLLQARVTVHFTEVTDKFSPHDSVFALAAADELTEHALAQASSLHTAAAPSSASSTSSRRKKLDGISEDAEEGPGQHSQDSGAGASTVKSEGGSPLAKGGSPSPEDRDEETASSAPPVDSAAKPPPPAVESQPRASVDKRPQTPASQPPAPSEVDAQSLRSPVGSDKHYATSVKSFSHLDYLYHDQGGGDRRNSSQTARSGSTDLYDFSYLYKPKVKLGPRPTDSRPHTSGNGSATAKVPASLKAAMRKATSSRPKSKDQRDQSAVPSIALPPQPPIPTVSDVSTAPTRPPSSRGSATSTATKPSGITPEKQRLLKALELRKRQMKKAEGKKEESDTATTPDATAGAQQETASTASETATEDSSTAREHSSSGNSETTLKDLSPSPKSDYSKVDSAVQLETGDHSGDEGRAPTPVTSSPISASDPSSTRPTSISDDGDSRAPQKDETEAPASSTSQSAETENPIVNDPSEDQDHARSPQTPSVTVEDTPTASEYNKTVTALPAVITPIRPKRRSWQKKSRGTTDQIRIDIASADTSDAEYLSDDSFMEELKSAKVEQAKPMSVSKSPIMPIFPRRRSSNSTGGERLSSNPLTPGFSDDAGRLSPGEALADKGRSFSAPGPPTSTKEKEDILAKKVNVSSGISQRIKALAQQSNQRESQARPTIGTIGPSLSSRSSPDQVGSVVAQRAASFRSNHDSALSRPSSAVSRHNKRFSRSSISSIPVLPTDMNMPPTPAGSPPPATPLSPQHTGRSDIQTTYGRRHDKPDSITVTARIIRQKTDLTIPTDGPVELQPSPLTIDHVRANQSLSPPSHSPTKTTSPHSGTSTTIPGSPTKSISASPRDSGSQAPRTSSESSWRNFGRRRSEILMPPPTGFPRSQSITSMESAGEDPEKKEEKKGSRTSRLLKRMSNGFGGASRKSLNQMAGPSTVQEEEDDKKSAKMNAAEGVEVGDLNVQFPDTLLWKRRFVEIDTSGNIVLSLSRSNEQSKGITKRYHLSEFKAPIAPDLERQEMPNSVILDFQDGRTLQCACEDMSGQIRVLEVLRGAWGVWSS